MKVRSFIYVLIGLVIASLYSCEKILNEVPRNSTHANEFWKTADDISKALAGNYSLLRNAITSGNFDEVPRYFIYGDGVQGTYFTIQYSGDGLEGVQTGDFTWRYTLQSYGNWTPYYKAITMSNLILKRVSAMDVSQFSMVSNPSRFKNEALGQAYFIRALSYFMLTKVWGDVPLITTVEEDPINAAHLGRSPKAEILELIEKDCLEAINLLEWTYNDPSAARVTANKGSVYALLAHLYLWKATTTNVTSSNPIMEDVDKAQWAITQIKSSGNYSQVDTASYYSTFIGQSREGIFEVAASEDHLEGSNKHIANFFLREAYIDYNSPTWSRFYVDPDYLTRHFPKEIWGWVWENNAWNWRPLRVGELTEQSAGYPNGIVVTAEMLIDDSDTRYKKNFVDISTAQPTCIKYHNVKYRASNNAYVSNNIILFRYSDMLLLEAEIALYKDDVPTAINIINAFRTKNGSSALIESSEIKAEVLHQYILERGKELYLEGHLYYDLIRTRQYAEFIPWMSVERFAQEGFYWPISTDLFRNNSNLIQTRYWVGKI